ncbi:MAG TPA: stalk domain-containing protein [Bacilli bacterium]|nr:stalk domain-containing protein [Bacilli bacterium]
MRKILAVFMAVAFLLAFTLPHQASAATPPVKVEIDDKAQTYDQPPVIMGGRTMVPMRAIFEALGATVTWDNATRTVTGTKGKTVVKLTIGSDSMNFNGQNYKIDSKAVIVNSHTMVPVRFVAEAMGAIVKWDAKTYTVQITSFETSAFAMIHGGHLDVLKEMLKDFSLDYSHPLVENGLPILYYAIAEENIEAIKLLVENGADVNMQPANSDFGPPLYSFLSSSYTDWGEVTQTLIDSGADINQVVAGVTPLMTAIYYNKPESFQVLLDAGADFTVRDEDFQHTALEMAAAMEDRQAFVDMLRDAGATE